MELKTFSSLLEGRIFQIPDYQRVYVWEQKQWKYFAEDFDAIIDDKIICSYKGTIVIYQPTCMPKENYGTKKLEVVDIVDGQQRLITCSLYLSIILNELIKNGEDEFKSEIPIYLLSGTKSKIRLHNDTADLYFDLISKGSTNVNATTVHQKRLLECYNFLKLHLRKQTEERRELGIRLGINFVTEDGISMHYSSIISPSKASKIQNEYTWLSKIKNTGNIANYLPLMVAARKKVIEGDITDVSYINFLKAIEQFSSRVSTLSEKPGNAVLSEFYKWAYDIFSNQQKIESVTNWIMEQ